MVERYNYYHRQQTSKPEYDWHVTDLDYLNIHIKYKNMNIARQITPN